MSNDKETLEHYNFVSSQYYKLYEDLVKASCDYLHGEHKDQGMKRWILCGRVISCLFVEHFKMSINEAHKQMDKVNLELKDEGQGL